MAIHNNTTLLTKPINTGKTTITNRSPQAGTNDVAAVTKKAKATDFSMVLSTKQKDSLEQTQGYDQPGFKQRGALAAYQQVALQEQRDAIINSMSFHFVV